MLNFADDIEWPILGNRDGDLGIPQVLAAVLLAQCLLKLVLGQAPRLQGAGQRQRNEPTGIDLEVSAQRPLVIDGDADSSRPTATAAPGLWPEFVAVRPRSPVRGYADMASPKASTAARAGNTPRRLGRGTAAKSPSLTVAEREPDSICSCDFRLTINAPFRSPRKVQRSVSYMLVTSLHRFTI
jgi:hypothetical protein